MQKFHRHALPLHLAAGGHRTQPCQQQYSCRRPWTPRTLDRALTFQQVTRGLMCGFIGRVGFVGFTFPLPVTLSVRGHGAASIGAP
jgi:hypothetical protein